MSFSSSFQRQHNVRGLLGFLCVLLCLTSCLITTIDARAILGVDLGSLYMKVALVQSGSPLEIVTNLHSKRKTEQMILFDREQRFYGADASALLARKSQKTPAAMSVLLGRDDQHPVVQVLAERHYPITPLYNETRSGVVLNVDGVDFTPEELVAMVLTHAVDISVAHAAAQGSTMSVPPKDCVLTVASYATQRERQALLDAAQLAGLNVLTLIDETTAAALHYAMDKTFADADNKNSQDQLFVFYNMGASALQVSLIHFYSHELPQKYGKPKRVPALTVLSKTWDETLGGQAFDHLLVEHLADEFNALWRKKTGDDSKDVRSISRAMTKLRLQANKIKHVLSANTDVPVHMDALCDDVSLSTHVTRAQLEEMAAPLLERAIQPITKVLQIANKTWADVTGIELIGGGMRIPRIQAELSNLLQSSENPSLELGLHINADESMALGAAFAGANISTAFRVRHVGMTDINPFAMKVSLENIDPSQKTEDGEVWGKEATIFPSFGKMGVKKTIKFKHDQNVACALDYDPEETLLPAGSELALTRYKITGVDEFAKEMAEKGLEKPQVSLQFELSSSGIASLVKAEASVVEVYTVEEEVEIEEEEADKNDGEAAEKVGETDKADDKDAEEKKEREADKEGEEKKEDDKKEDGKEEDKTEDEKKEEEEKPKKKIKIVEKEQKRTHKKTLSVETSYAGRVQPHTPDILAASTAKLLEMAQKDKERMMLEEAKNNLESYIYRVKNTLSDREKEISKVTNEKQREEAMKLALDAQAWMDDEGYAADLATTQDKFAALSGPFEKIMLRLNEVEARPKAIEDLQKKLTDVDELMKKWETSKPQVTEEERKEVLDKVAEVRTWIEKKENEQKKKKGHEDPAFLSEEVPGQIKPVETLVMRLSKKPKPKPPKKEENKTDDTEGDKNATSDETVEENKEGKQEEAAEKETAEEEAVDEKEETSDESTTQGEESADENAKDGDEL